MPALDTEPASHLPHAPRYWYLKPDGSQRGPIEDSEIWKLIGAGVITAKTLVLREGEELWCEAGEIEDFEDLFHPAPHEPIPARSIFSNRVASGNMALELVCLLVFIAPGVISLVGGIVALVIAKDLGPDGGYIAAGTVAWMFFAGVVPLVIGCSLARIRWWSCGHCGNRIIKTSKCCPTCNAIFDPAYSSAP